MDQSIVHIMSKTRFGSEVFEYDLKLFHGLYDQYNVENIICCKGDKIKDKELISRLKYMGVSLLSYSNKLDLEEKLKKLSKKTEILYINTTSELHINIANGLKKALGQKVSDDVKIFRNKYLQRELLQKNKLSNGVRFLQGTMRELSYEKIRKKVGTPFILKPTNGIQSAGVVKICNKKDFNDYKYHFTYFHENCHNRGFESDVLIAEEFIDGDMYSIDYFVSQEGRISISRPVAVTLGVDLGIDDFFNGIMTLGHDVEKIFENKDIKEFIESTVKATGIRNSYVHHEFKINSKGKLKTIELNGRIGGGRAEMYHRSYGVDLYAFVLGKSQSRKKLKENFAKLNVYAPFRGELKSLNNELLEHIHNNETVYEIERDSSLIGKEVGLTKDGFIKIVTIKLKHQDNELLHKEIDYILQNYNKLVVVEPESKFVSFMHVIKTFTYRYPKRKKKS